MFNLRLPAAILGFAAALSAAGELSNRPAPAFRLPDSLGRFVSLSDYKGKVVVIEFMSTTCPHCQKFAPVLENLQTRYKGRVGVLSIAAYPDNAQTVAQFAQKFKVTFPLLVDPQNTAAMDYLRPRPPNFSFSIPHVFVIDKAGYIRDDFVQNPSNASFFTADGLVRLVQAYLGRQ